jgi:transcriptional regulator with XRE-family HTH domain
MYDLLRAKIMTWEILQNTPDKAAASIGAKIRQHRLARNITQSELAAQTSMSCSTVKRIEAAGQGSLRDIMAIAIQLGIDHDIITAIPPPPLQSLADLDNEGRRKKRVRAKAYRRSA